MMWPNPLEQPLGSLPPLGEMLMCVQIRKAKITTQLKQQLLAWDLGLNVSPCFGAPRQVSSHSAGPTQSFSKYLSNGRPQCDVGHSPPVLNPVQYEPPLPAPI